MLLVGAALGIFAYRYFLKGGTVASVISKVTTGVKDIVQPTTKVIAQPITTDGIVITNNTETKGTIIVPETTIQPEPDSQKLLIF